MSELSQSTVLLCPKPSNLHSQTWETRCKYSCKVQSSHILKVEAGSLHPHHFFFFNCESTSIHMAPAQCLHEKTEYFIMEFSRKEVWLPKCVDTQWLTWMRENCIQRFCSLFCLFPFKCPLLIPWLCIVT